jgi:hypothetical protein
MSEIEKTITNHLKLQKLRISVIFFIVLKNNTSLTMFWNFFLRSVNTCILRVFNAAAKPEYLSNKENISKSQFVIAVQIRYIETTVMANCQESMAVNCFGYFSIVPNFNTFLSMIRSFFLSPVNMRTLRVCNAVTKQHYLTQNSKIMKISICKSSK